MKNPLLMSLCVLYIQKGWDPIKLVLKYDVLEADVKEQLFYLIENKVIARNPDKLAHSYLYIPPQILGVKS